jgi:aminoglycoside phosphotransferase (APT) family kinase protein
VRRLIALQFPQWAGLPIVPVEPGGWDNRTFRLGEDMAVRLPSAEEYSAQVEKEVRWLARLAPFLPLPIPLPLAKGAPGEGFPWSWSVYRWIAGEPAARHPPADLAGFAADLGGFLAALQRIDVTDGPPPGPRNFFRGGSLATYDGETREALRRLEGARDVAGASRIWDRALGSRWNKPPVWVHGDVAAGNLLVDGEGRLCGVIDFGCAAVGDPACDLAIAWTLFDSRSRAAFRDTVALDEPAWERGRGWALWKALITLAALPGTNPSAIDESRRVLREILAD